MKFVADDGKVFDTMEECQEYEYNFSAAAKFEKEVRQNVFFYDCNGDIVNFPDAYGEDFWDTFDAIAQDTDLSAYIKIIGSNKFSAEFSNYCYKEIGATLPHNNGIYRWDNELEDWIEIDSDIKYFCGLWEKIYPNMRILKEG